MEHQEVMKEVEIVQTPESVKREIGKTILKSVSEDARQAEITFIDGLDYILKHPGDRKATVWLGESVTIMATKMEDLLDNFFRHVVVADRHSYQPTLDTLKHPRYLGEWQNIALRFLRGNLAS